MSYEIDALAAKESLLRKHQSADEALTRILKSGEPSCDK